MFGKVNPHMKGKSFLNIHLRTADRLLVPDTVGLSNMKQCFNEVYLSLLKWSVVGTEELSLRAVVDYLCQLCKKSEVTPPSRL